MQYESHPSHCKKFTAINIHSLRAVDYFRFSQKPSNNWKIRSKIIKHGKAKATHPIARPLYWRYTRDKNGRVQNLPLKKFLLNISELAGSRSKGDAPNYFCSQATHLIACERRRISGCRENSGEENLDSRKYVCVRKLHTWENNWHVCSSLCKANCSVALSCYIIIFKVVKFICI